MSDHRAIFKRLAEEFHPSEVRERQQGGTKLRYITARVAMNRLDEVLGAENWKDEFTETEKGLRCRLYFRIPGSDEWLWKEDGGAAAGMKEVDNDEKSSYSDAFKRAAVKLGVARYLYNDGVPIYSDPAHVDGEIVEEYRPTPPSPAPGKPAAPKHPNRSGFGSGQYCPEDQRTAYLASLTRRLSDAKDAWDDHWRDPQTKDWPDVVPTEFLHIKQLDRHLVKWAVERELIHQDALEKAENGYAFGRHIPILLNRQDKAQRKANTRMVLEETNRYIADIFGGKKEAIYAKHPELAPDGWAEEQVEADRGEAYDGPGSWAEAVLSSDPSEHGKDS